MNVLPIEAHCTLWFVVAVHVLSDTSGPALVVVIQYSFVAQMWPARPEFDTSAIPQPRLKVAFFTLVNSLVQM